MSLATLLIPLRVMNSDIEIADTTLTVACRYRNSAKRALSEKGDGLVCGQALPGRGGRR